MLNKKSMASKLKKSGLWKPISLVVWNLGNFIWNISYGLKPYIIFLRSKTYSDNETLRKKGLMILRENEKYSKFANSITSQIPEDLLGAEIKKLQSDDDIRAFTTDIFPLLNSETKCEILSFALSDDVLQFVLPYFKLMPRLASIKLLLNIPKREQAMGSQRWHRDWFVHKGLNVFTCLTSVDDVSGRYSAIGLDWIPARAEIEVEEDFSKSIWDRGRVDDETMSKYIPEEAIESLEGSPGTTAIVAGGDVYHKGGHCKLKHRLMLEISFQMEQKPSIAKDKNIIETLELENDPRLQKIINSPTRQYLTGGFKEPSKFGAIFHWINRKFTYYLPEGYPASMHAQHHGADRG